MNLRGRRSRLPAARAVTIPTEFVRAIRANQLHSRFESAYISPNVTGDRTSIVTGKREPNNGRHFMVEFLDMHFLATLLEREFDNFRLCIADMKEWPTYDDFVMDREGYFIGMSWAGLSVVQVEVPFRLFMRWIDLTGSPCGLRELDDFAMRRWLRAKYPDWNPRLVPSKATSLVADWSGQLYIPIGQAAEVLQDPLSAAQSDEAANHVLARAIVKECLDPVG